MIPPDPEKLAALKRAVAEAVQSWEFHGFAVSRSVSGPSVDCADEAELLAFKRILADAAAEAILAERPDAVRVMQDAADLLVHVTWPDVSCALTVNPLWVYGRYQKRSPCMPNTRWPCRGCGGNGVARGAPCLRCSGSGRMYLKSVEDLLAVHLVGPTGAVGTRMHACGREDIDARMLGSGRPFLLELARPRYRSLDLAAFQEEINFTHVHEIHVTELTRVTGAIMPFLADVHPPKRYEALVALARPIPCRRLAQLPGLGRLNLTQHTPQRVAHRRADLYRYRWIEILSAGPASGGETFDALVNRWATAARLFRLRVRAQSGAYIKEFISGDDGRTSPSLSSLLGGSATCLRLDVTEVEVDPLALFRGLGERPHERTTGGP